MLSVSGTSIFRTASREVVAIMRAWGKEKFASSEFRRARGARNHDRHHGTIPFAPVDEYLFDSLADFEAALAGMSGAQFRSRSGRAASLGRGPAPALGGRSSSG
jgi:hypothetical protein